MMADLRSGALPFSQVPEFLLWCIAQRFLSILDGIAVNVFIYDLGSPLLEKAATLLLSRDMDWYPNPNRRVLVWFPRGTK